MQTADPTKPLMDIIWLVVLLVFAVVILALVTTCGTRAQLNSGCLTRCPEGVSYYVGTNPDYCLCGVAAEDAALLGTESP